MEVTPELVARLRQEADVSREEAARLLAAHEGSLLDALLDLEHQGRARPGRGGAYSTRPGQAARTWRISSRTASSRPSLTQPMLRTMSSSSAPFLTASSASKHFTAVVA